MKKITVLLIMVMVLFTACGETIVPEESETIDELNMTTTTSPTTTITPSITTTAPVTTTTPPTTIITELVTKPLPIVTKPPQIIYEPIPLPPHLAKLNWVVELILEYEWFGHCFSCDVFIGNSHIVDEKTGLATEQYHPAHGTGVKIWVYDPVLELFGIHVGNNIEIYPLSEFTIHFPNDIHRVNVVRRVDSTIRELCQLAGYGEIFPQKAFSGAAIAIGNEFITDFIYNSDRFSSDGRWFWGGGRDILYADAVVDDKGMFGVIYNDGRIIIPFEFDEIRIIDERTAFVKHNERWGIVAFNA
jgi:hypothetical protein